MRERIRSWQKKSEDIYHKWHSTKWSKGLNITTGVFWNLAILLAILLMIGGVFAASVGAGYFASLVDEEELRTESDMRGEIYAYEETSEIFFGNDEYLGKLKTDLEREETNLDMVSDYAIDAVLATEDEYFNEHEGIVPKAIFRGLFQDVSNADSQTGGSTLTQQLIKNQILTNEVSYERKAKEILLAMRLEKFMKKEEILEAYLNIIPYGRNSAGTNIAGIETAANGIFNVPASELNLPQAAFIAGIPKAPFRYTPYSSGGGLKEPEYLEFGIDRMRTVLYRMLETEFITQEEYDAAIAYDIIQDFREDETRSYERYPHITTEVEKRATRIIMDVLAEEAGIDPASLLENDKLYEEYQILADRAVRSRGYRIHSSIDKELYDAQQAAKNAYESYGPTLTKTIINQEGEEEEVPMPVQVASVTTENDTGRMLSFVGGRDHEVSNFNYATQASRSIGSTAKPLLVYGPALEYGKIGAGSPVVDVKFEVMQSNGRPWTPSNFTATSEQGIMSARDALAQSQNLPAIRLFAQIQNQMPITYLMKNGFSSVEESENANPTSALGGGIEGTAEEVANAYATFANGGTFAASSMIDRIEDPEGNIIFEHEIETEEVYTPQTSYVITDMLRDVFSGPRGTANRANDLLKFNADFAGKSGTTQETRDVWLVGYNPNVTMSVWLGYDQETSSLDIMRNSTLQPSTRVNQVWATLMNASYDVDPELFGTQETFEEPAGIVSRSFCGISGLAPSDSCSGDGLVRSDLFIADVMVPTKPDDSLTTGRYTTIDGSRYAALSSTPAEFVSGGGVGVSEDFIDRVLAPYGGDASKLFPSDSRFSNVVSSTTFDADNAAPGAVQAALNGSQLTWSDSASNDVVGYRVYRNNSRVGSISESAGNSYTVSGPGSYTVRAVDITGRESSNSNTAAIAAPEPETQPNNENDNDSPASSMPSPPATEPEEPAEPAEPDEPAEPENPPSDPEDPPEEPEEPEEPVDPPEEPEDPEDTDDAA
ncbi:transglycosylase domain-containing protein [Metaplanococcus flavidus]|uniref:Transglycosylase domain-containing protein n=1 Tax=Metaplanococcus flavidus TaxID=569883 RepID=A0ABW3L7Q4_9BACL